MHSIAAQRRIGILLFDGVEELDAVGPWEVFGFWTTTWPDDGWQVLCFAADGRPVTGAKGLTIVPQHATADLPPLDVLLHRAAEAPGRCSPTAATWTGSAHSGPPCR